MSEFLNKHSGKLFTLFMVVILSTLGYVLYMAPVVGLENKFIYLMKEYGYIILFFWGMLEGEMGLVMAGLLTHTGDMNLFLAIFVAGLGGFAGDQVYFYIGRFNKKFVHKKLKGQRRKLALATYCSKDTVGLLFLSNVISMAFVPLFLFPSDLHATVVKCLPLSILFPHGFGQH